MQQGRSITLSDLSPGSDSDSDENTMQLKGAMTMRIEQSGHQTSQAEEGTLFKPDAPPVTATPARRAAIEALEREFQDLLQGHSR
jgi:hypothetical protein